MNPQKKIKHKTTTIKKLVGPAVIEVDGGVSIHIDERQNVVVYGFKKMAFRSAGEINLEADNINLKANKEMLIQTKKLNINPKELSHTKSTPRRRS
jgi:phage major head subunit gpT-like protein